MSVQGYLILFAVSVVLGSACYALSRPVFRKIGKKPYFWNGTGLPIGIAIGINFTHGLMPLVISMAFAGIGGLLGAYVFSKIFPR